MKVLKILVLMAASVILLFERYIRKLCIWKSVHVGLCQQQKYSFYKNDCHRQQKRRFFPETINKNLKK